jgi:hypothetical protein
MPHSQHLFRCPTELMMVLRGFFASKNTMDSGTNIQRIDFAARTGGDG